MTTPENRIPREIVCEHFGIFPSWSPAYEGRYDDLFGFGLEHVSSARLVEWFPTLRHARLAAQRAADAGQQAGLDWSSSDIQTSLRALPDDVSAWVMTYINGGEASIVEQRGRCRLSWAIPRRERARVRREWREWMQANTPEGWHFSRDGRHRQGQEART